MAKYYKVLARNGRSCHGGNAIWSLPTQNDDGTWSPGDWMPPVEGDLEPCRNGYHLAKFEQLLGWLGDRIFEVEPGDEIVHTDGKSVARTCRLIREFTSWNKRTARLFACDCAERVLSLYEARYDDDRPRKAIETARRYAEGKADVEELAAARTAAWEAAEAAALNTSLAAAEDAVWAAAGAAEEAAWAAVWATEGAAWDAVWAAEGAVWDAAQAAAEDASRAAARAAAREAREAERQWQVGRLRKILEVASDD